MEERHRSRLQRRFTVAFGMSVACLERSWVVRAVLVLIQLVRVKLGELVGGGVDGVPQECVVIAAASGECATASFGGLTGTNQRFAKMFDVCKVKDSYHCLERYHLVLCR